MLRNARLAACAICACMVLSACNDSYKVTHSVVSSAEETAKSVKATEGNLFAVTYDNSKLVNLSFTNLGIDFQKPLLSYTFTSPYGARWGRMHKGVDLAVAEGTSVYAAEDGTIYNVSHSSSGYGNCIIVYHGKQGGIDYYTRYAHLLDTLNAYVGKQVKQGEKIALSGNTGNSTGPHLHFEILENLNAVDPTKYLDF